VRWGCDEGAPAPRCRFPRINLPTQDAFGSCPAEGMNHNFGSKSGRLARVEMRALARLSMALSL
jgi:hypothetical protein